MKNSTSARLLLGLTTAATIIATATGTAAAAQPGDTQDFSYLGHHFEVPRSWPVIDLAAHPSTCVRFDQHAVYLGTPGQNQDCPTHLIGRTEALLVQPKDASSAEQGTTDNTTAHEYLVAADHLQVTGTYDSRQSLISTILAKAALPAGAPKKPALAPATFSPAVSTSTTDFTGNGFDACTAPSSGAMNAWRNSPFGAVGVYIGGSQRACAQANLTSSWVSQQASAGWHFMPIYVGPQANQISSAASQGTSAADDAINQAATLGFGTGSPLYYDMEAYGSGASSTVLAFLSSWTQELHARGYRSAVYCSSSSGIKDLVHGAGTGYLEPDVLFDALWNNVADANDPVIPGGAWVNHQRVHQYSGGTTLSYGGTSLNVDQDYLDVAVGGSSTTPTGPFYHDIRQADGSWQGWIGLAGVNGAPSFSGSQEAITGLPDGSTQLVGIGIDGNIYHNIRSGSGSWQGWVPVAGFNGAPNFNAKKVAIAGLPDGSTQFIATGVDGNIYHNVRAATGSWQGWVPVAGFNGAPNFNAGSLAITGLPDGSTQMTATGVDGNIYHNVRAATGSWQGWIPVAGFNGAPNFNAKAVAIAGLPDGSAQFIATGIDGNIYHNVRAATGSWQGWIPVAGFNGAPNFNASAVAMAGLSDGSTQMLAVGVDGNVYHNIRSTTGSWQGWIGVQGAAGAPTFNATGVSIAALPDNSTQLVAIGH